MEDPYLRHQIKFSLRPKPTEGCTGAYISERRDLVKEFFNIKNNNNLRERWRLLGSTEYLSDEVREEIRKALEDGYLIKTILSY